MVQNKRSSILHDMAKIATRHDNIVSYGGIFYAMNEFKRTGLDKLVDGRFNVRCANYGYQYSDIMLALFSIYLCGGDHIEDITTILNKYLSTASRLPVQSMPKISVSMSACPTGRTDMILISRLSSLWSRRICVPGWPVVKISPSLHPFVWYLSAVLASFASHAVSMGRWTPAMSARTSVWLAQLLASPRCRVPPWI